ncbi:LOW QUALITY PROTEIN: potassium voltage-gated channel subfamily H member 8-like [Pecten maximus]|uniref:LOW QUALITY PROTEIN: potassium voltage-gated channel subfamily H member 8-like n=1 Tax=Pecten maximus TaxID=6579 RepID=UPI0014587E3E|nr:LOW QUALITY PROTEIN: potassium voltage-gated channel subfamily H member 8-like [Pecten maximus]
MTNRKGFLAQQNTFLDTIATRFDGTHSNFVLGNAQATGCPIVYCSDGFCELTGYSRAHVMGKSCSCKFLRGPKTNETEKEKIDEALENIEEIKTEILLYRKGGLTFWCLLDIIPIKNEKSQIVLFLVSYKDISRDRSSSTDIPEKESSDDDESDDDLDENFRPPSVRCRADMPTNCNYQRRRSRAVLYHLSGQFEKQNKAKSKLQKLNKLTESISGKMPEYKVQEVKKSRYVISHYGIFKIGWDWLILLCTFYTAIMVPYNAAFTREQDYRSSIYSDVLVEILFMIDIVLNFRTSFVSKSGQIVYDGRMVAINYIRGWFPLDLLAAIPFDFLYTIDINTNTPVHLLKVARLLRLARLLQKIDRYSQYSAIVIALLMLLFALTAHWLACIWYAIGYHELLNSPAHWTTGWLFELSERLDNPVHANSLTKPGLMTSYVSALYFTCSSLTSVGFGNVSANTNAEKIFSVCAMLVGAMLHAVVFGNVTAIIQRMYARRATYHSRTKDLKDFFRTHHIPKPLKHRMQEYFQTMWSMNNGMEAGEILKDFPDEMRGEISLHLHKDLLSLAIFENATQGCLKAISLHTRRAFSAPGEFIIHKGDAINYVYLLCSGSMEVLKTEMVVAILGKGDLFGTDINLEDPIGISCCDVRSLTYCELQGISIKGLAEVLSLYPDFADKFSQDIRHDLTYNLKEGTDESDVCGEYEEKLPITRVMTLPSISEDDEETDSDHVFHRGENSSSPNSQKDGGRESSPSSPLLADKPFTFNIPNGDIEKFSRDLTSPPSLKRGPVTVSSPAPKRNYSTPFRRSSLRKQRHLATAAEKGSGIDTLSTSLQNLQTDFEGTKTNIFQIERKVDTIGSELTHMDERLKSLIEILTPNPSVHSESPPNTPFTPYTKPKFSFGSPTSEDNMINMPSHQKGCKLNVPCSSNKKAIPQGAKPRASLFPKIHLDNIPSIDSDDWRVKANKSCDNIYLNNNEHQILERRHSDGPPDRRIQKELNGSVYVPPESLPARVHGQLEKHSDRPNCSYVLPSRPGCSSSPPQEHRGHSSSPPNEHPGRSYGPAETHSSNSYGQPPSLGSLDFVCDIDTKKLQRVNSVDCKYKSPSGEAQTVHTISTGDCSKPPRTVRRIPRSIVLQGQHLPSAKNVLETTDL